MKLKVFCIYDSKVKAFTNPMYFREAGEALRAWENTTRDESTMFSKFPADYTLFEVGYYDELTGDFTNHEAKINLGTALQFSPEPAQLRKA